MTSRATKQEKTHKNKKQKKTQKEKKKIKQKTKKIKTKKWWNAQDIQNNNHIQKKVNVKPNAKGYPIIVNPFPK